MRKLFITTMLAIVSISTFAGGILTNTNQHVSFLRMIARGASIDIDGVYSNPAGLAFLEDGFYVSLNGQSAYQTRTITSNFEIYPAGTFSKKYKGTASAPFIPSVQAAYKNGDWSFSGSFAVVGGGGKASFNKGLPMFDSKIMALLAQNYSLASDKYVINSAMDGKQFIYGFQLGASYKINDYLSVFGGGRMNYVKSGYEGYLDVLINANVPVIGGSKPVTIDLDCDQTGWGLTPIIGADIKFGKWNVGLKYEFMTNINIENKTRLHYEPEASKELSAALNSYKDGVNTPNDIPALLSAAVRYEFMPTLRATVEYHHFFDKNAQMADVPVTDNFTSEMVGKQKTLKHGTHEFLVGAEWDITKILTVSAGYQNTNYGATKAFQTDTSFSLDSYSVGFGAAINLSSKLRLNVAYFWTDYKDFTKDQIDYNGTGKPGTDVYSRTNKVFGLGVDYKF